MKITIPILPETINLLRLINSGVEVEIEEFPTHFVIDVTEASVDIISQTEIENLDTAWLFGFPIDIGFIEE